MTRARALRQALLLEQVSIIWMLAEGGIAIASGIAAHSLALAAFGWDSLIEFVTAGVVLWRVLAEMRLATQPDGTRTQAAERLAARVVAMGLFTLVLYILLEAIPAWRDRRVVNPGFWGLAVSAAAAAVMPALYVAKRRVADLLGSEALLEDATGNLACGLMAAIVLAGLVLQRWGLWWADPVAALTLAVLVAREAWEAWGRAGGERSSAGAVRVYLGLGSNLGDRAAMLARARGLLDTPDLRIVAASRVYETSPWGVADQPRFLNQVIEAQTTLSPREVLERCHAVEARLGRERSSRWGPRTIDVDILLYGTWVVSEPDLTIPHPQLAHRAFVLVPLAELDASARLPGGDTIRALLDASPDRGDVREYQEGPAAPANPDPPRVARVDP